MLFSCLLSYPSMSMGTRCLFVASFSRPSTCAVQSDMNKSISCLQVANPSVTDVAAPEDGDKVNAAEPAATKPAGDATHDDVDHIAARPAPGFFTYVFVLFLVVAAVGLVWRFRAFQRIAEWRRERAHYRKMNEMEG